MAYHSDLQQLFSIILRSLLLHYQSNDCRNATHALEYCL